jgi:hypothetical protein
MPSLSLRDRAGLDEPTRTRIEAAIADHGMLDRVVRWALASHPPRPIERVVVQDEYTHDVVVGWGDGLYLVYDCT